jgi:hypothetical protein
LGCVLGRLYGEDGSVEGLEGGLHGGEGGLNGLKVPLCKGRCESKAGYGEGEEGMVHHFRNDGGRVITVVTGEWTAWSWSGPWYHLLDYVLWYIRYHDVHPIHDRLTGQVFIPVWLTTKPLSLGTTFDRVMCYQTESKPLGERMIERHSFYDEQTQLPRPTFPIRRAENYLYATLVSRTRTAKIALSVLSMLQSRCLSTRMQAYKFSRASYLRSYSVSGVVCSWTWFVVVWWFSRAFHVSCNTTCGRLSRATPRMELLPYIFHDGSSRVSYSNRFSSSHVAKLFASLCAHEIRTCRR